MTTPSPLTTAWPPSIPLDEPAPAPAGAEVAVLVHHQRHDTRVRVFASYPAAFRARAGIARAGWAALAARVEELPATAPVDDAEAAETYFAHQVDEDAAILLLAVQPDPPPGR
jgi:hypothetical protein